MPAHVLHLPFEVVMLGEASSNLADRVSAQKTLRVACFVTLIVLLLLQRRAMLGLPDGDTDPYFDTLPDQQSRAARNAAARGAVSPDESNSSDSDSKSAASEAMLQDPPELVAARQRLEAYQQAAGMP